MSAATPGEGRNWDESIAAEPPPAARAKLEACGEVRRETLASCAETEAELVGG
jgi:hypothetical protein